MKWKALAKAAHLGHVESLAGIHAAIFGLSAFLDPLLPGLFRVIEKGPLNRFRRYSSVAEQRLPWKIH
ncbi:hypothetical protein ACFV0Z_06675 [Streptomyces xiamenensis]|uniref:hypothetical protein n=1 Tax=Streptomyces xiamenensis TaxID=408015 RepID=UPI0036A80995